MNYITVTNLFVYCWAETITLLCLDFFLKLFEALHAFAPYVSNKAHIETPTVMCHTEKEAGITHQWQIGVSF